MTVTFRHRVRYHEVDQQGFLFNGRYFEIADVAMTEFFRDLGWSYAELNALGVDPSVVHTEADFAAPARFDDDLDVSVDCVRVGETSFALRTIVECDERHIARIDMVYVNVDAAEAVSRPLPDVLRTAMQAAAAEPPHDRIE